MIQLDIFNEKMDEVEKEATEYANKNVQIILQVLIDMLEDNNDFAPCDFLPRNNLRIDNDVWRDRVYELYDIVKSPVIRTYMKPKYEILLYIVLEWWENCADDEEILPNQLDSVLRTKITRKYEDDEENTAEFVIKSISNYEDYYYIFFQDHDFMPSNVEKMVMIYLRSTNLFQMFFPDTDLNDYRELMPVDLLELYDEKLKEDVTKQEDIDIEEALYKDIIFCCEKVQANCALKNAKENTINDQIRNLLDAKIYTAKDQTRQGISSGGKDAGNLDILIEINKQPIALVEALKLDSVKEKYIQNHIDKIFGYDTKGYKSNYLIAYVKSSDFSGFVERYITYITQHDYPYERISQNIDVNKQFPELRTIEVTLDRHGIQTKLFHILIHMPN